MVTQNPDFTIRSNRPGRTLPRRLGAYIFVAALALPTAQLRAQESTLGPLATLASPRPAPGIESARGPDIRVDSTLVLIPVTVTDPLNRFVTGLDSANFKVMEDKTEQRITTFSSEDLPISIGLVFDCSGSMGPKLAKSRLAVAEFLKTANPEDEFFLVQFNDTPRITRPFTRNPGEVLSNLAFTESKGQTALLDAVYLSLQQMKKASNPRKALLIISDGGDNHSRYSEGEIKNLVRESDVQIYAAGIFESPGARGRSPEEMAGPDLLSDIAGLTGGRAYPVDDLEELPDIAAKIGLELRNQYILGYAPQNQERDGKYRRVQVKIVPPRGVPPLHASWRLGYYAPGN